MKQIVNFFLKSPQKLLIFLQRFVPSGCQFWNPDIISSSRENFAYCSTTAIYIHTYLKDFQCSKLFALKCENNTTRYSFIAFHPQISNILTSVSTENILNIWDIEKEKIILIQQFNGNITFLQWSPFETDVILLAIGGIWRFY